MSENLNEEKMRLALFGPSARSKEAPAAVPEKKSATTSKIPPAPKPKAKSQLPRLRVTLRVSKEFEGDTEVFVHDANTLSTISAEQEARTQAKKKKFRYFELVSVTTL